MNTCERRETRWVDVDARRDVILTGIGGQGIQLCAKVLALAAAADDHHVMLSSYFGGEMRGGRTEATVVTRDETDRRHAADRAPPQCGDRAARRRSSATRSRVSSDDPLVVTDAWAWPEDDAARARGPRAGSRARRRARRAGGRRPRAGRRVRRAHRHRWDRTRSPARCRSSCPRTVSPRCRPTSRPSMPGANFVATASDNVTAPLHRGRAAPCSWRSIAARDAVCVFRCACPACSR